MSRSRAARALALGVASFFGSGLVPIAPGTAGSLAALALAAVARSPAQWTSYYFLALVALWFLPGVWAAGVQAELRGAKDPQVVVVDEVIGQWVALAVSSGFGWKAVAANFVIFRLMDIWKPFPARRAEALPGGWGIMADDVVAGIYAGLVLRVAGCFNLY